MHRTCLEVDGISTDSQRTSNQINSITIGNRFRSSFLNVRNKRVTWLEGAHHLMVACVACATMFARKGI